MENRNISPKSNLILHGISLILAVCCAILNEEPAVRMIWLIGTAVWAVLIIMDIRTIIRNKKNKREMD